MLESPSEVPEALSEVWEGSVIPTGGPRGAWRPFWRSTKGCGGPPRGPGRVQEAHPEVWEALPEVREVLGSPPGGPVGVNYLSKRSRRCLESLPEVQDATGGPF